MTNENEAPLFSIGEPERTDTRRVIPKVGSSAVIAVIGGAGRGKKIAEMPKEISSPIFPTREKFELRDTEPFVYADLPDDSITTDLVALAENYLTVGKLPFGKSLFKANTDDPNLDLIYNARAFFQNLKEPPTGMRQNFEAFNEEFTFDDRKQTSSVLMRMGEAVEYYRLNKSGTAHGKFVSDNLAYFADSILEFYSCFKSGTHQTKIQYLNMKSEVVTVTKNNVHNPTAMALSVAYRNRSVDSATILQIGKKVNTDLLFVAPPGSYPIFRFSNQLIYNKIFNRYENLTDLQYRCLIISALWDGHFYLSGQPRSRALPNFLSIGKVGDYDFGNPKTQELKIMLNTVMIFMKSEQEGETINMNVDWKFP